MVNGTESDFKRLGGDGKVRLPIEFRRRLGIRHGDWVEFHLVSDADRGGQLLIVIRKARVMPPGGSIGSVRPAAAK